MTNNKSKRLTTEVNKLWKATHPAGCNKSAHGNKNDSRSLL